MEERKRGEINLGVNSSLKGFVSLNTHSLSRNLLLRQTTGKKQKHSFPSGVNGALGVFVDYPGRGASENPLGFL